MAFKPKANYYQQASDRLLFRTITLEDLDAWLEFFNEEDYHRFLGQDITIPRKTRATNWIEKQRDRMQKGEFGQLAVIDKASGRLIGLGGLIPREIAQKIEYEVTYSIIPRHWGRGFGTELALQFREYAKENIPIKSVISLIHPENKASIRVAEKNGMRPDGEHTIFQMLLTIYRHDF